MDGGWALLQLGSRAQADAVAERLAFFPDHRLEVREVREYEARGVLVLLVRPPRD